MQYLLGSFAENPHDILLMLHHAKVMILGYAPNKINSDQRLPAFRIGKSTEFMINEIGIHGPFKMGLKSLAILTHNNREPILKMA